MLAGVKSDSIEWGSRHLEFTQFKLCFLSHPTMKVLGMDGNKDLAEGSWKRRKGGSGEGDRGEEEGGK